jgi:hypothetical protein
LGLSIDLLASQKMKADFFIISAPNAQSDNLSKVNFQANT